MRLDHIAYRVKNREETTSFLKKAFGYEISDEFEIDFGDCKKALCYALIPPEKKNKKKNMSFISFISTEDADFHLPCEIFVSEGTKDSIVYNWVKERGGIGGIHHVAYQVASVKDVMDKWKKEDLAEFTTEEPIESSDLTQCFTKPHPLTGIIYEFIERKNKGFNVDNVKKLMISTEDIK